MTPNEGIAALAELVVSFDADDVPPRAEAAASLCLLDGVSGAVGGYGSAAPRSVRDWAVAESPLGAASVWWTGKQIAAAAAALANSAAASALDVDDGHPAAPGHPGAAIVPAVLAAAEEVSAPRERLVGALVIGYEVAIRVGSARLSDHIGTSGHWCGHGVAAAVGWLRNLDPPSLARALAIVSAHRPVVLVDDGPPNNANGIKEGIPWATFTGIASVNLAQAGLTGPVHALDHRNYNQRRLVGDWGKRFYIETVTHKAYACCRWFHPAIDALLHILQGQPTSPVDAKHIHVATFGYAARQHNKPDPKSLEEAHYSLPFCLAVAAHRGAEGLLPLSADLLGDAELVAMARRVTMEVDPSLDAAYSEDAAQQRALVTLETPLGTAQHRVDVSRGMVGNPLLESDLISKFKALAAGRLRSGDQQRLISALLDARLDASELGTMLRQPPQPTS